MGQEKTDDACLSYHNLISETRKASREYDSVKEARYHMENIMDGIKAAGYVPA